MNVGKQPISALRPDHGGHQFVFYGDCCSGIPGGLFERNFAQVNAALQRLFPQPEFIIFLGDHIMGAYPKEHPIAEQWEYWLHNEMSWLDTNRIPIYHTTSNHDTFDSASEQVWREVFPYIPSNGPIGQEGLSYWVRRGDLLLVFVNTNYSKLGGAGHVECAWLENTLCLHSDARYKIVAGHHPVFAVNGYAERPLWCIAQKEADAFWSVLVRHRVLGYLCAHIIAFDLQEHDSVLQICSGGAGAVPNFGSGGLMGTDEYHHLVQVALDPHQLRLQTIDDDGIAREKFTKNIHNWTSP